MEKIMSRLTSAILLSVAACAFTAAPSFAQSSYGGGEYRNTTSSTAKAYKVAKEKAAAEEKAAKIEALREEALMKEKAMNEGHMMKDDHMKADTMVKSPAAYGSSTGAAASQGSATAGTPSHDSATTGTTSYGSAPTAISGKPSNCPSGTTAQDNGTCLLTSGSLPGS